MHPALERDLLPASAFRNDKGAIDVKGLSEAIDFDQATMARVIGASRQSVSQYWQKGGHVQVRDAQQRAQLAKLDQLLTLLKALTDPNRTREETRAWFQSPNRALGMERPVDLVSRGEIDPLIRMLMDVLNASHGG